MTIKRFNDNGELVIFKELPDSDPAAVDLRRIQAESCNLSYIIINNIIVSRELYSNMLNIISGVVVSN